MIGRIRILVLLIRIRPIKWIRMDPDQVNTSDQDPANQFVFGRIQIRDQCCVSEFK